MIEGDYYVVAVLLVGLIDLPIWRSSKFNPTLDEFMEEIVPPINVPPMFSNEENPNVLTGLEQPTRGDFIFS